MTVLASREHTCIHPEVSRNSNKNEGCKDLNDRKKARLQVCHLSLNRVASIQMSIVLKASPQMSSLETIWVLTVPL